MVNTSGPTGSVNYVADETAPGGYRQVTAYSPEELATYEKSKQAQNGALDTAYTQLGRVNDALATPLSTKGLPDLVGGVDTSALTPGQLKYSFDTGQQVQGDIGPQDLTGAARDAADAVYTGYTSRLDPQFTTAENAERTRLVNQGLSENSDAYRNAMDTFTRGKNDAYAGARRDAVTQGLAAEDQIFGQAATQGQFHNSAAGQQYTQNQGAAAFGNQAEAQRQGEELSKVNADIASAQLGNTARNQGLQERAYIQNQPINQFTGLLGLGQVNGPQGISYTPSQVAPTDVIGANALAVQAQQANAARAAQANSGLMGGLMSLGQAAIMASDRRLKTDIRPLRRRRDGIEVVSYRYRGEQRVRVGVIAQDLRKVRPDLVIRRPDGMLAVNYQPLGAL